MRGGEVFCCGAVVGHLQATGLRVGAGGTGLLAAAFLASIPLLSDLVPRSQGGLESFGLLAGGTLPGSALTTTHTAIVFLRCGLHLDPVLLSLLEATFP